MSFAQIQLLGNVGRDPEMTYTQDGTPVTKFSIAVSRKLKKSSEGDAREETVWYNCSAWRGLAEMLSNYLKKGQMVFLQGDLNPRSYTTKDGRPGMSLEVTVEKFQFAGGKKETSSNSNSDDIVLDPLGDLDDHPF